MENKIVKGILKGKALCLSRRLAFQNFLTGQTKHSWLTYSEFTKLVRHIVYYPLGFLLILRQINGIDNKEHLVQGKGILHTAQLNQKFSIRPAKSMVVISNK